MMKTEMQHQCPSSLREHKIPEGTAMREAISACAVMGMEIATFQRRRWDASLQMKRLAHVMALREVDLIRKRNYTVQIVVLV